MGDFEWQVGEVGEARTILVLETEHRGRDGHIRERHTHGGKVVEGPAMHLGELRRDEGGQQCAEAWRRSALPARQEGNGASRHGME